MLLLEAGGWDRNPWIKLPFAWGKVLRDRIYSWNYETEPEPALDNRRVECARGKVIGGSSSINAMAYVRGHRADYDRWAASGCPAGPTRTCSLISGGRSAGRAARTRIAAATGRSRSRPRATRTRWSTPICEAGRDAGHPATADYNGAQQDGFARMQMTIRHGHRCSAAVGYLRPALGRSNLQRRDRRAGDAHRVRGHARRRCRVSAERRAQDRACRARGDPRGRRRQLAADPDAVRHRRSGGTAAHGIETESAAARRRQEPAGSSGRSHYLCAHRARSVAAEHAARSHGAQRRAGARLRHRIHHQPAGRHHGVPQERCRREPARRAVAVHRRAAVRREALSRAVPAAVQRRLRLPHRGAAAAGARHDLAEVRRSGAGAAHRAKPARHRSRQAQDPRRP